jgi:hypothetical protein
VLFGRLQNRQKASDRLRDLMFFFENVSDAAAKTATFVAPALIAAVNPCRFGVSTGYVTPSLRF